MKTSIPSRDFEDRETEFEDMVKLDLNCPQNHPTGISQLQGFFRTGIAHDTSHGFGRQEFKDIHEEEEFLGLAIGFMMAAGAFRLEQYRQDMNLSWGKKIQHSVGSPS